MPDVCAISVRDNGHVKIEIFVDGAGPPMGQAKRFYVEPLRYESGLHHAEKTVEFVGWLGLLRAISELLDEEGDSGLAGPTDGSSLTHRRRGAKKEQNSARQREGSVTLSKASPNPKPGRLP